MDSGAALMVAVGGLAMVALVLAVLPNAAAACGDLATQVAMFLEAGRHC